MEYLYTIISDKNEGLIYGVFSPEDEDREDSTFWDAVEKDDLDEELLISLEKGISTHTNITTSKEWGSLMSSYVPIKNAEGKIIGVLAGDVQSDTLINETKTLILILVIVLVLICCIIILILNVFFKKLINNPLKNIVNTLSSISLGDFTDDIDIQIRNRKDEIGTLGSEIQSMKTALKELVGNVIDKNKLINSSIHTISNHMETLNVEIDDISNVSSNVSNAMDATLLSTNKINTNVKSIINILNNIINNSKDGISTSELINKQALELNTKINESKKYTDEVYSEIHNNLKTSILKSESIKSLHDSGGHEEPLM